MSQCPSGGYDPSKAQNRFWIVRVTLDTILVGGASLLTFGMLQPAWMFFRFDSHSFRFLWAVSALICSLAIVWLTCTRASKGTRQLTSTLLAVAIFSLASVNFLLAWLAPDMLLKLTELQWLLLAFTAWGLICLGLISIETRLDANLPKVLTTDKKHSLKTSAYRLMLLFQTVFLLVATVATPIIAGPLIFEQCASAGWPQTVATLVEPHDENAGWLSYSYQVNGIDYIGTREVSVGSNMQRFSVTGNAQARLTELRSSETFLVAYNPMTPAKSLLQPGISNFLLLYIWCCGTLPLLLPLAWQAQRLTFSDPIVAKQQASVFLATTATMSFVGLALGIGWTALISLCPWQMDRDVILLIIGIGCVYQVYKKTLCASQEARNATARQAT